MISDNLRLVKKGCVVINTAREGLIDTEVLVELVKSGKISCGLDVVDENFKEELLGMDNVVLTDHIGASTVEAREKVFVETIENVEGFINKEVRNVVNV
jgi:D-3-phosphoglycerate dehydrogenase